MHWLGIVGIVVWTIGAILFVAIGIDTVHESEYQGIPTALLATIGIALIGSVLAGAVSLTLTAPFLEILKPGTVAAILSALFGA